MASENPSAASAKRNRIIAIVAGTVTIAAVVVAFAAEYFELPWKWLRPSVELLLLAELVGLVVLERHQLFEPVQEKVTGIEARMADMQATH
jgi:ABC-type transport system involved in cytochrome c biogenesis permease subunit